MIWLIKALFQKWIFIKCFMSFSFSCLFAGEVERLLKEYRQNQELVRRIGGHYYQIIYPVQLRHHEKMGISTREVAKVRNRLRKRNTFDSTVCLFIFISSPHTHTNTHTLSLWTTNTTIALLLYLKRKSEWKCVTIDQKTVEN